MNTGSNQSRIKEELTILRAEKKQQSELLEKLTTDNSRLISQVSGTARYGMVIVCVMMLALCNRWRDFV